MIDINKIRNNKEEIEKALLKRLDNVNLDQILNWDKEKRQINKPVLVYEIIGPFLTKIALTKAGDINEDEIVSSRGEEISHYNM